MAYLLPELAVECVSSFYATRAGLDQRPYFAVNDALPSRAGPTPLLRTKPKRPAVLVLGTPPPTSIFFFVKLARSGHEQKPRITDRTINNSSAAQLQADQDARTGPVPPDHTVAGIEASISLSAVANPFESDRFKSRRPD